MREILVAVDLGPSTDSVLDAVAPLLDTGARLHIVHVAPPDPAFVGYDAGPPSVRDQVADELRGEHRALDGLVARARARGHEADGRTLRGPTVDALLEEADRVGADLIVVGRHARSAVVEALVGSTARALLHRSARPVLVVPPGAH